MMRPEVEETVLKLSGEKTVALYEANPHARMYRRSATLLPRTLPHKRNGKLGPKEYPNNLDTENGMNIGLR